MKTATKKARAAATSPVRSVLTLPALDPGVPLGEAVFQSLYRALQAGIIKPGDRLREEDVAAALMVSRTPVREALGRMQARRFVVPAGGRGLLVRQLERGEILELYAMRAILEGAAARLAAIQISEPELHALQAIHRKLAEAGIDPNTAAQLNRRFHEAIVHAARNRYLDAAFTEVNDVIPLLGITTFSWPRRHETAAIEHGRILEALQAKDVEAAEQAARDHLRESLNIRLMLQN